MGCYYATGKFERASDLNRIEGEDVEQFGLGLDAELYEMTNSRGMKCKIGVSSCRDGFDLWLIIDGGMAIRA